MKRAPGGVAAVVLIEIGQGQAELGELRLDEHGGRSGQRPWNWGRRFSEKAFTPSW